MAIPYLARIFNNKETPAGTPRPPALGLFSQIFCSPTRHYASLLSAIWANCLKKQVFVGVLGEEVKGERPLLPLPYGEKNRLVVRALTARPNQPEEFIAKSWWHRRLACAFSFT